ncbi:MAG: class I SAM-dependent methyltransferase [Anaerolineales bacterium]|jgi:SAM-dependent methyltransferase
MTSTDPYQLLARYYDLQNADVTEDLPFWLELAQQRRDPILELGCGTGRVLIQLARDGHTAVGVDRSEAMLARAQSRLDSRPELRNQIELVRQDFSGLELKRAFDLILMPFNTFAHLLTRAEQSAALQSVHRHLEPGGSFAFDLPNPAEIYAASREGLLLERILKDEERGCTIQVFSSFLLERNTQQGHITWFYDEVDEEGRVSRTTIPMTLRYFFPDELVCLLEASGLAIRSISGDFDHGPLEEDSDRMVIVAEKPATARPGG